MLLLFESNYQFVLRNWNNNIKGEMDLEKEWVLCWLGGTLRVSNIMVSSIIEAGSSQTPTYR